MCNIIVICSFFNGEELYIIEGSFFVVENQPMNDPTSWLLKIWGNTPFVFGNVEMTCYFGNFQTPSSSNKEHWGQIVPKKTIYEKHSMNIACLRITNQKHFDEILTRRLIYTFEKMV